MAVIVTIRVDPITGKSELIVSRLNQASEIWASKGATTRVAFISMGLNAGQFLFAAAFEDFFLDDDCNGIGLYGFGNARVDAAKRA